jgi:hypothetical protein
MKAPTGGLISLITHKVHSFSAMKALTGVAYLSYHSQSAFFFRHDGSGYAGRRPEK